MTKNRPAPRVTADYPASADVAGAHGSTSWVWRRMCASEREYLLQEGDLAHALVALLDHHDRPLSG
jgi:hypothetical protein